MGDDGAMGSEALFDCLESALRAGRDAGRVAADEYAAFAYPTWFRSLDELRAPFAPTFTGPGGEALALIELEPTELADPFLDAFRTTGDAATYGRDQAAFLEGFLRPSFPDRARVPFRRRRVAPPRRGLRRRRVTHRRRPARGLATYRLVAGLVTRTA